MTKIKYIGCEKMLGDENIIEIIIKRTIILLLILVGIILITVKEPKPYV